MIVRSIPHAIPVDYMVCYVLFLHSFLGLNMDSFNLS